MTTVCPEKLEITDCSLYGPDLGYVDDEQGKRLP